MAVMPLHRRHLAPIVAVVAALCATPAAAVAAPKLPRLHTSLIAAAVRNVDAYGYDQPTPSQEFAADESRLYWVQHRGSRTRIVAQDGTKRNHTAWRTGETRIVLHKGVDAGAGAMTSRLLEYPCALSPTCEAVQLDSTLRPSPVNWAGAFDGAQAVGVYRATSTVQSASADAPFDAARYSCTLTDVRTGGALPSVPGCDSIVDVTVRGSLVLVHAASAMDPATQWVDNEESRYFALDRSAAVPAWRQVASNRSGKIGLDGAIDACLVNGSVVVLSGNFDMSESNPYRPAFRLRAIPLRPGASRWNVKDTHLPYAQLACTATDVYLLKVRRAHGRAIDDVVRVIPPPATPS